MCTWTMLLSRRISSGREVFLHRQSVRHRQGRTSELRRSHRLSHSAQEIRRGHPSLRNTGSRCAEIHAAHSTGSFTPLVMPLNERRVCAERLSSVRTVVDGHQSDREGSETIRSCLQNSSRMGRTDTGIYPTQSTRRNGRERNTAVISRACAFR